MVDDLKRRARGWNSEKLGGLTTLGDFCLAFVIRPSVSKASELLRYFPRKDS